MSRRRQSSRGSNGRSSHEPASIEQQASKGKRSLAIGGQWLIGGAVVLAVAFLWSYWPTITETVNQWVTQPDYSHGFLVIPIALFFLWTRRSKMPRDEIYPSLYGVAVLAFVCALRIAAGALFLGPLDGWTIPIFVAGAVLLLFGWPTLKWSLPCIAFLWFMIPMPFQAESFFSVPLQYVATRLSTGALVMLGQPALVEGNTIWVGEHHMFVEEACAGLRIFMGIFALAFAFALFSRWSWWQKLLAIAAVLPIAIIANVTRIVATALLQQLVSGEAAARFSHDLNGLVMIPLAALLFWLFLIYLDRLFPEVQVVSAFDAGRMRDRTG